MSSLLAVVVVVVCTTGTTSARASLARGGAEGRGQLEPASDSPGITGRHSGGVELKRVGECRRTPLAPRPVALGLPSLGLTLPVPALVAQAQRPRFTLLSVARWSGDGRRSRAPP